MDAAWRRNSTSNGYQRNNFWDTRAVVWKKKNCPNLEANEYHLRFTVAEAGTRCLACLHFCASISSSGTLSCYHYLHSRNLSNRRSYVLSTQRNTNRLSIRHSLNQKTIKYHESQDELLLSKSRLFLSRWLAYQQLSSRQTEATSIQLLQADSQNFKPIREL